MTDEQHILDETSFEHLLERLQEIVDVLEQDDQPLEKSLELYREGMVCASKCRQSLQKARHEISVWQNGTDVPFVDLVEGQDRGMQA